MRFCAIDVETVGDVPRFRSGALWSDDTQLYTESHGEYLDALRVHARKRYVFAAHNAEYDGNVTFWNAGEDFAVHYINDGYDCGYWTYGSARQRAQLWDTVRLTAGMSLAELGAALAVPKYPTPKALVGEDDWRQSWLCERHDRRECVECYNLRDAEIVWSYCNMLREWLEPHNVPFRRSLPGIAVGLWKVWDRDRQQTIRSKQIRALARLAFHGGRNELFKYGKVPNVYTYDVRSHYGYILATRELPDCSTLRYEDSHLANGVLPDGEGVIEATVYVEPQHIPPLPVMSDGRIYYPVGTFRGAWPLSELRYARDLGATVGEVHRIAWTETMVRPFEVTASTLLQLREDALRDDDPRQLLYKFLLNAIIGRLGMREVQQRRIYRRWRPGLTQTQLHGQELESAGDAVYLVREFDYERPSRTSNILWAACITGMGRVRLYQHLLLAGGSTVYCDTDSIHSVSPLTVGVGLPGDLVPTGVWDSSLYVGPKLYRLASDVGGTQVRAKGIPKAHAEEYLTRGSAVFPTSLTVREAIRRGMPSGTWLEVTRQLSYGPGPRTVHDPFAINDRVGYSPTSPVVFTVDVLGAVNLMAERNASA